MCEREREKQMEGGEEWVSVRERECMREREIVCDSETNRGGRERVRDVYSILRLYYTL